jgi:hypothetical protein
MPKFRFGAFQAQPKLEAIRLTVFVGAASLLGFSEDPHAGGET